MRPFPIIAGVVTLLLMISVSACLNASTTAAPASAPTATATARTVSANVAPAATTTATDIVVYAADLPKSALTDELDFANDSTSPGGKLIALPNAGDKLNPPPEDDPHVTFTVQVQGHIPYRCWIHMKVGAPKGVSLANVIYVQFSNVVDKADQGIFMLGTDSYLTARGPKQQGRTWVGCDAPDSAAPDSLVYFDANRKVIVRLQAGMEGVGFDQFLLSPARFLQQPPSKAVVQK